MIKRKISLALAIMMTFSFVGCDTGSETPSGDSNVPSVDTPGNDNDNTIDDGHVHAYTQKVLQDKYKKFDATCENKATYYYSCDCGEAGTDTYQVGAYAAHDYCEEVAEEKYKASDATCEEKAASYLIWKQAVTFIPVCKTLPATR